MIGRAAYNNPYLFSAADRVIFNDDHPIPSREDIVLAFKPYCEQQQAQGVKLGSIARHLLGLFHGCQGARQFRRYLSEHMHRANASADLLNQALAAMQRTEP